MRISNDNPNRRQPAKPIGRMNDNMLKDIDMRMKLNNALKGNTLRLRPTGGLALHLADNANKYSKMKVQGEV
jgi:hypothetical protein